jgi:hypothetical protein
MRPSTPKGAGFSAVKGGLASKNKTNKQSSDFFMADLQSSQTKQRQLTAAANPRIPRTGIDSKISFSHDGF